jgi:hypothetical protein
MSHPRPPVPVKLIISLFSPDKALVKGVLDELSAVYGPTDWISPELFFDQTTYYAREMGWPLHRRFASFARLIAPEQIVSIKLWTNEIEKRTSQGERRKINIDPGYLSSERLILATGKNFIHRVYLTGGIYADLTLIFEKGSFKALPWTYRDYADPEMVRFFNDLRNGYRSELKEMEIL